MSESPPPILGTVSPGRETYCPLLARHLDATWPGHPPLHYALPAGRTAPYERTIPTTATAWTAVLLEGLSHLRDRGAARVFVLLEDHVPLWRCDAAVVEAVFRTAAAEDLAAVFFTKYDWPWPTGAEEVLALGGQRLVRVPADYRCYNQCQPAVWRADYLASLLAEALRRGIEDPWTFERFSLPGQPPHYVSEYRWPSRHCGYRRRGRIYLRSLYAIEQPAGRELRDALIAELFPALPPPARRALGGLFRLWGRARRMPERFLAAPQHGRRA